MRALPALLVALLCLAAAGLPVAGLQAGDNPSVTTVDNTTNQLTVPDSEVSQSTHAATGVDVGTAVQTGSTALHHRHDTLAFEERFRAADSDEQRTRLLHARLSVIEQRQRDLDTRQDVAMREYAAGEATAIEFLRTRLRVNAEATELLATLDRVSAAPDTTAGYTLSRELSNRIRTLEGELVTLQGPVGTRLESAVRTNGEREPVYLEGSSDGYTLATVDGDYVRETRLDDERDPTLSDQFLAAAQSDAETDRFSAADDRASELYGWLYERQRPSFTYYGTSGIYELSASHSGGELVAYIDGGTTNVFYEAQTRTLADVETTDTVTAVSDTQRVTLQRSTRTGPMLVTASDNETDATVDGRVTIDGQPVGSTGSNGALWIVEPSGSYTVNVTSDEGRTTVTVPAS
jgi:hypothetical protein